LTKAERREFPTVEVIPIKDLNECSVLGCNGQSETIIQKVIGDRKMIFGYCRFHAIISATFFSRSAKDEIRLGAKY
jgi:hypothetical protein